MDTEQSEVWGQIQSLEIGTEPAFLTNSQTEPTMFLGIREGSLSLVLLPIPYDLGFDH